MQLPIITWNGTAEHNFFESSPPESTAGKIYQNMKQDGVKLALTEEDIDTFLNKDSKAVYYGSTAFVPLSKSQNNRETLYATFLDSLSNDIAFVYPLDSELAEVFDYHLRIMKERGVLEKLQLKWGLIENDQIETEKSQLIEPLGFQQVIILPIIIIGGIFLSILCLILENSCQISAHFNLSTRPTHPQ